MVLKIQFKSLNSCVDSLLALCCRLPDMKVTFVLWTLCAVLGSASTRSLRLLGDGSHPDAHNITNPVSVASSRGSPIPFLLAMQTRGREERVPLQAEPNIQVVSKKAKFKKESCKTQPLKQVVRMKGCLKTKIINHFCYGQCNSFFIPRTAKQDKVVDAFMSCGFCRPRHIQWILVTLRCPTDQGMRYRRKKVQFVKKCRCMAQEISISSFS